MAGMEGRTDPLLIPQGQGRVPWTADQLCAAVGEIDAFYARPPISDSRDGMHCDYLACRELH
jgi:hypothetical protein